MVAVVVDLHGEVVVPVGDAHRRGGQPGMAGWRWSAPPARAKRGQADTDRRHAHLALDFGSDLQAHPMRLRDQRIQPGECRGGRSGLVLLAKKSSSQRSSPSAWLLAWWIAARELRAWAGRSWFRCAHTGVHVDQGQMVAQRVVELPGDAQAFLADSSAGLLGTRGGHGRCRARPHRCAWVSPMTWLMA